MKTSVIGIILLFCLSSPAFALRPVESLVLGNFSEDYSDSTDPLNYVFNRDENLKSEAVRNKSEIALYRGFYEEGKNLTNYCKEKRSIRYTTEWEKVQVKRSVMGLAQYIGLDLLSRAIPKYARILEFSREEYANMVEGLVGNYCSNNLTVISKRELLNNLFLKFDKENIFSIPGTNLNPLFPGNTGEINDPKISLRNEFLYSVKLFQSLCSWNGNPNTPGLLTPILRHSGLMAFFIRQMNGQSIGWKEKENTLFLKEDPNTVKVWCENLICRRVSHSALAEKVILSVGGTSIGEDLRRLYCEEIRDASYTPEDYDPRIGKMMKGISFDEENFINSQFIALITVIPDFLLRAEKFTNGEDIFRASVDHVWTKWANKMSDNYARDLFFEEPLTMELVDRKLVTDFRKPDLRVGFDVNLGEFDRINQQLGKAKISFTISIPKSFLKYYRRSMIEFNYGEGTAADKERLKNRFKLHLIKDVKDARDKFIIPPWRGDLEGLLTEELTAQILEKPEKILTFEGAGDQLVTVEVSYGLFALKYINHQLNVQKSTEAAKSEALK